jgi:hypothetical protein
MSLNALLHVWYAQHVAGTCMPIIRSSRLYVSRKRDAARRVVQRPSCWTHSLLLWTWPATSNRALHTIGGNNTHIVSSSWWWAYKWPKHVERIISAIKHSVTSIWFLFSTNIQRCTEKHTSSKYMMGFYYQNAILNVYIKWFFPKN